MGSCPDTDIDPKIAVSGPVLRICKVMRSPFRLSMLSWESLISAMFVYAFLYASMTLGHYNNEKVNKDIFSINDLAVGQCLAQIFPFTYWILRQSGSPHLYHTFYVPRSSFHPSYETRNNSSPIEGWFSFPEWQLWLLLF